MVKTKEAFKISVFSALIIGILYWIMQSLLNLTNPFSIGVAVFIVAFVGMKWGDWF